MKKTFALFYILCSCMIAKAQTDISKLSDAIYTDHAKVVIGTKSFLPISIKSSIDPVAFQFDIIMPQGVSPDMPDGIQMESANQNHIATVTHIKENTYRVLCFSLQNEKLLQKNNVVAKIGVHVDDEVQKGNTIISIENIELTSLGGKITKKIARTENVLSIITQAEGIEQIVDGNLTSEGNTYNLNGQKVIDVQSGQVGVKKNKKFIKK